jgi:endonuclease/exonuclease/phosphatase (EEP) superfamily protein YafD
MSGASISVWRRYANAMVLLLNVIVGTALVVTAYSGYESPVDTPIMGVIILSFPAWLALSVFLLVADMIWWHKTALVPVAAILASWPTVWASCPLNIGGGIPHGTPSERVFTLLTYNVNNLRDVKDNYPGGVNPILSEILRIDADIACVQELKILECNRDFAITQAQIDSLHARYPFVTLNGHAMAIFSKYPVTPLHLEKPKRERDNFADISGYVAEVEGHRLAIFSVHMQSFRLTREDKAAYRDLTRLRSDESIDDLRNTLLYKLELAAMRRAVQASDLCRYIEYYGGENVVVCGDFNDVPGCYTLHMLADQGLKEVWPEVAFGPTHTYNDNRFFFRIDHVLWKGAFRPAGIKRGDLKGSDHYPLLTTFVWDEDDVKNQ